MCFAVKFLATKSFIVASTPPAPRPSGKALRITNGTEGANEIPSIPTLVKKQLIAIIHPGRNFLIKRPAISEEIIPPNIAGKKSKLDEDKGTEKSRYIRGHAIFPRASGRPRLINAIKSKISKNIIML